MTTRLPGGSVRVRIDSDGVWHAGKTVPLEQPTDDEHRAFTEAGYYALSQIELMRRLRTAEWDAAEHKRQVDEHAKGARYTRSSDAQALARVSGLVDHRRKTLRMWDLRCALGLIPWEEQQAGEPGTA